MSVQKPEPEQEIAARAVVDAAARVRAEQSEAKLFHYLRDVFRLDPEGKSQRKIVVLLSGGVDSSVALACLKRFGCQNIAAYYLKIWFQDDARFLGDCPWEEDLEYATAVCEQLDVPLHVVSMQQEYYRYVVEYTLAELRSGRTPSPDLFCNQFVKFGSCREYLEKHGDSGESPLIVSGHYAQLRPFGGEMLLQQAPDPVKDQSYFLSRLSPKQLQNLLFPLGCLQKTEVRLLAEAWGLATAQRKDSQGICFLGKVKFRDFACHYLGRNPGPIVDMGSSDKPGNVSEQAVLGRHEGLWFHTIGQRQGLGLGGGPWYVYAKDMEQNILYVRHADLYQEYSTELVRCFSVGQVSWLQNRDTWLRLKAEKPQDSLELKLRHGPKKVPCRLERLPDEEMGSDSNTCSKTCSETWRICMESGDRGVAPGQFAVLYWGDICLGSASILYPESGGKLEKRPV
ncbi:tRNA 2-thiouridine(34) synthase MnmA [Candidatus Haliotispira prima]|uniref:tRNA-uridine 2-sulfurtransferase n=1 Tax=Candidatus Haliotispira prima TaxID=3034016 RepID=A0ABY8MIJ3_9SPIO|nr:tRNA 2-thiouridine(34) synthase MnmA [Candidatus Haliotispira prima]